MKYLILLSFLLLVSCKDSQEFENFITSEKNSLPLKVDDYLTLTSVDTSENQLVYTMELSGMTTNQQAIMINAVRDQAVTMLRHKNLKAVWKVKNEIKVIYQKRGQKLKVVTLTEKDFP